MSNISRKFIKYMNKNDMININQNEKFEIRFLKNSKIIN